MPESYVDMIIPLLRDPDLKFKIVKPRKTKLGDFRVLEKNKFLITVNGDLNQYSFLITTLHEIAHLRTFKMYGRSVAPHGIEWKTQFAQLLQPFLNHIDFPKDIRSTLLGRTNSLKASSCTDPKLHKVLSNYDEMDEELVHLDTIPKNSIFALGKRQFRKGDLRRTRYLCNEIQSNRAYLVSSIAKVKLIENYDQ